MAKTNANGTTVPEQKNNAPQFSPDIQAQVDAQIAADARAARTRQESARTTYYWQENGKLLYEGIKQGTLPLFDKSLADDRGNIAFTPEAIRSASSGNAFKGNMQLIAQQNLKALGLEDKEILTYEQAGEKNIKKGQPHFVLTTYDAKTKQAHRYNYYPVSAVIDPSKITRPVTQRNTPYEKTLPKYEAQKHPDIVIDAHGTIDPATYTGKYLAACSLGAKFCTDAKTQANIQEKLVQRFAPALEQEKPAVSDIYKFSNEASAVCKDTLSALHEERTQSQERKQEKNYKREVALENEISF